MSQVSYADVFSSPDDADPIGVGDVVQTGPNPIPQYAVIAISGDKAWLRNVDSGHDAVTGLDHCRRVDDRRA